MSVLSRKQSLRQACEDKQSQEMLVGKQGSETEGGEHDKMQVELVTVLSSWACALQSSGKSAEHVSPVGC